jgi:hypothetical protein
MLQRLLGRVNLKTIVWAAMKIQKLARRTAPSTEEMWNLVLDEG